MSPAPTPPQSPIPGPAAAERGCGGPSRLPYETVALVLQGGGALGAYQAGVAEGLAAAGIEPNWIAGISIGAINTALLAGNPPETRLDRLRTFWETVCQPPALDWAQPLGDWLAQGGGLPARRWLSAASAWRALLHGQPGFFAPRGAAPWWGANQGVPDASFYDTAMLKSTLERLVDFDRLNDGPIRVSVGAVQVRTGNFVYFDNTRGPGHTRLRPEHIMASGALPPAFPAVEIDGEPYWDGGLVSNTPLAHVLAAVPRRNSLVFQVDLWSARGPVPDDVYEVQARLKDIQYSSRTRAITDSMARDQHYRHLLRELLRSVPAAQRAHNPWLQQAEQLACSRQYSVIHLIYQSKQWEGLAKDYEFSIRTMREHWHSGLADIQSALSHPQWLELPPPDVEFVTHDIHRHAG